MGLSPKTVKMGDSRLTINGDFKQMVYASDSAQYIPNLSSQWMIPLSRVKRPVPSPFPGMRRRDEKGRRAEKIRSLEALPPYSSEAMPLTFDPALSAFEPPEIESLPATAEAEMPPLSSAGNASLETGEGPASAFSAATEVTQTSPAVPPDAMPPFPLDTGGASPVAPGFGGSPVGITPFGAASPFGMQSQQNSSHNQLSLRYLYMDPKGYTPFRFDMMGSYNTITADYIHRDGRFQASVGSGKDLRGGLYTWNDLRLNARYTPNRNFLLGASTAYDLNGSQWRDLINELDYRFGKGFINLGTRYSPVTQKIGSLKWNLYTPLGRRYSLQTYGGWNGYANRYDYRVMRFNWELHDFRVSLSYVEENDYRSEKGIHLTVALRAFPIAEETATGQYGQSLDTSVGSVY
jgi:hypothetical protein